MSCREWQDRLQGYVDAEMPPQETEAFRAHVARCPDCASAALSLMEAKGALRRAGRRYEAPPELRARVVATVRRVSPDEATEKPQSRTRSVIAWPRWAMAAAAALLLAAGLFFCGRSQRP